MTLELFPCKRTEPYLLNNMSVHYSNPKGFVGRNICYLVKYNGIIYGSIVGGSATRFLPNRYESLDLDSSKLNNIVNNIFFHVEPVNGEYPIREFLPKIIKLYRQTVEVDWFNRYGDKVLGHETLVELPRVGECYKRDGWTEVGITKGFTCKRTAGEGTDSWSGKRVWNTNPDELKPKRVFIRKV